MEAGTGTGTEAVAASPSGDASWLRFDVSYEFAVHFTRDLFEPSNPTLADALGSREPLLRHRFLVFVDAGVVASMPALPGRIRTWANAWADRVELADAPLVIAAGEALKQDWRGLEPMRESIRANAIDRHSFVLAIGGGALLDAAGLVCATAHRGIRHVRLPSTVLAQADGGVGVKNGINRYGQKNYLGTFAPPFAVINDSAFLDLLGERDRRAGMAEAVKVALIRDAGFFRWLERSVDALVRFDGDAVGRLVRRCAELHMYQIAHGGDPFELGSARPLDFGHWAAHRLEILSDGALRHGEAVAIGIALDTRYSVLAGHLAPGVDDRVAALLEGLGFRLRHPALEAREADGARSLARGLADFRAHLGGELTITLPSEIGRGIEVHEMDDALVERAVDWLGRFA